MSEWISVNDMLPSPDDKGHCLIYRPDSDPKQGSKYTIVIKRMVRIMTDATHWMPLPEPPKGSE